MQSKSIFFVIAIVLVVLLFSVPPYSVLFDTTVVHPPASYSDQISRMDAEYRRQFRYGNSYSFFIKVEQAPEQGHIQDPTVLLRRKATGMKWASKA